MKIKLFAAFICSVFVASGAIAQTNLMSSLKYIPVIREYIYNNYQGNAITVYSELTAISADKPILIPNPNDLVYVPGKTEQEFEAALKRFLSATTKTERNTIAQELRNFDPLDGKNNYSYQLWHNYHPVRTENEVTGLTLLTNDQDNDVCRMATTLLATCGDAAIPAIPRLFEMRKSKDGLRPFESDEVLQYLAERYPLVRAKLMDMSRSAEPPDRVIATQALNQWNWQDPAVKAHLIGLIKEADDATAEAAAEALRGSSKADWNELLPILFTQLDSKRENRAWCVRVLPEMDEKLNPYLPRIFTALGDRSPEVRLATCNLIERLAYYSTTHDVRASRTGLFKLKNDPDKKVQEAARNAIAALDKYQSH